ncbi:hypothetical protein JXB37_06205 [candidate division WOR-3 bacterium]|nr:hypothetical protein [candidate division WOR-3 bacterium]
MKRADPRVRGLLERFGVPAEALAGLDVVEGQGAFFIGTREVMTFDAVRPLRRGIRFCRVFPRSVKPTTHAMQVLGRHATRNVIDLEREQVVGLINGEQVEVDAPAAVEDGYVLLRVDGFSAGVGLYRRPVLKTQLPRYRPVEE